MARRSSMSRQEAGRLGAEARWGRSSSRGEEGGRREANYRSRGSRLGREFYQEIGHRGGQALVEEYGPEYMEEIGRRGGRAVAREYGPEYFREIGRRGGEKVAEEYGPEFYEEIGHRGGSCTLG